jgi:uncharacterized protein YhaN
VRFRRLDLIAFGRFTDVSLELQRPADLHLVYGSNEAGKTTALRAIQELLYGMPVHTDLAFLHPMNRLRLGAVVEGAHGETLEIVRRKGRVDTLRTPDDEPVPEARLAALLGGAGRQAFETMFGIHHDRLVAGGEELLRGEGEVGQSLYGAAMGAGRVHRLLAELDRQAEEVYRPRGSRLLNRAMADHEAARRRVRELQLRPQQWLTLHRAAEEAQANRERLDRQVLAVDAELRRLRRLGAAMPLIARRERLLARAAQLGDEPDVPAAVAERHRRIAEDLRTGEERERETADRLAEVETATAALSVDEAVLAKAAEIRALAHGRGRYEKDARDRDALGGRLAEVISHAGALLRQVWPDLQVEVADRELRLTAAQRDRLDEAIACHPVLRERRRLAERGAARLARDLDRRRSRLAGIGDPPDPAPLQRALERSRRDSGMTRSLSQAAEELAAAAREADSLLAQLGLAGQPPDAAAALPVPARERVTLFQVELVRIDQEARAIATRLADLEARRTDLATSLRAQGLAARVPSMEDLRTARERRDLGWTLVRRAWLDGEDVAESAAAYAGPGAWGGGTPAAHRRALPDAYAAAVAAADETADDLRQAGERVLQVAQLRAALEVSERELTALSGGRAALEAERGRLAERWRAEWAPAGVAPGAAEQMQSWLDRHARLVGVVGRIAALREGAASARAVLDGHAHAVARALAALGQPAPPGEHLEHLEDLRIRADAVVAALVAGRRERDRLLAALEDLEAQRREHTIELEAALADLAAWDAGWRTALVPLRLPPETTPTAVRTALERLSGAVVKIDESNVLRTRREGIRRDMEQYEASVAAIVAAAAPDLRDLPPAATTGELEERLARSRDGQAQRQERLSALGTLRARQARVAAGLQQDRTALTELMDRLGATTREDLDRLMERAAKRREIARALSECESELLQQGSGWTLEQHVQEATDTSPERLAAEVAIAEERLSQLRREHEQAIGAEAAARSELSRLDGSDAAADAAQVAEEHRARVAAEAGRFVQLRVAHAILNREIELYRERHQAPVLRHAGEIFREITLGRYTRLRADTDAKDRLVLVAVTAEDDERTVTQMSAGTRDQLYLALRLATLTVHFETSPPMPVVLDDILVNFDDDRSRATLRVLAALARQTQVLLFAHHTRLLELARSSLPADAFAEHVLPPPGRPGELAVAHSAA